MALMIKPSLNGVKCVFAVEFFFSFHFVVAENFSQFKNHVRCSFFWLTSSICCLIANEDHTTSIKYSAFARVTLRRTFPFNLIDFKITLNHVLFIFFLRVAETILTFAVSIFGHANFSPFSITMYMFNLMCSNRAIERKNTGTKEKTKNHQWIYQLERNKVKIKMRSLIFGSS